MSHRSHPAKVRLTADVSSEVADALKNLARAQNVTLLVALSRAIGTESVLWTRRQRGAKVLLDEKGRLSELVFAR